MPHYILQKDHLNSFLRKLRKENTLVAPVKNRYGDTRFQHITDTNQVDIDLDTQPQDSIKSFLFPQQEVLFRYRTTERGDQYTFGHEQKAEPTIYFGVRSCDLSAVLYMDVIFLGNKHKDPYYFAKRNKSLLISFVCNDPFQNCFCKAARSGPFLECGFDLQMTDLQDRLYVEIGHGRGQLLIEKWGQFFRPATKKDERLQTKIILESQRKFKQQILVDLASKKLHDKVVKDHVWAKLSSSCTGCGGCAYVCPTCTCYVITDKKISKHEGERLRSWDACTFAGFTRLADKINPINMNQNRVQRRFMHKLHYDVLRHKRPSCVGCGRCVDMCFGDVDMIKFIQTLNAEQ